jgi:hypothetical protein
MNSHIVCVVRHCGWQYCVCDDEFDTCDNNMFYCVATRGGKQNWQHNYVLYRLTSMGYGHYRRKLLGLTSVGSDHSRWKLGRYFHEPNPKPTEVTVGLMEVS